MISGYISRLGVWLILVIFHLFIKTKKNCYLPGNGVKPDIIPLVEVPHVGAKRARALCVF